jgi:hypothetical protein
MVLGMALAIMKRKFAMQLEGVPRKRMEKPL